MTLDGGASEDRDGTITAYAWVQTLGPGVAITDADTVNASFVAPDVPVETELGFELTVTDDEHASDADSVTVTIVPAHTAAIAAGMALLKHVYRPDAIAGSDYARAHAAEFSRFVGLWSGARVRAIDGGWDTDVDLLLDELRVLAQLCIGCIAGAGGASDPPTPFALGQREIAAFTRERDPATSALALETGAGDGPVPASRWLETIGDSIPRFAAPRTSPERTLLAQEILLAADTATPGADIAAALLVLLLPPNGAAPLPDLIARRGQAARKL